MGRFAVLLACTLVVCGCFDAPERPGSPALSERPPTAKTRPTPAPGPPLGLDLWVWEGEVAYDPEEARRFFEVVEALGSRRVYLSLDRKERARYLRPGNETLRRFLRTCAAREIDVELLLSENTWVFRDKRGPLYTALRDLTVFQESVRPGFSGVHLDVEPHGLAAWKDADQKPQLVAGLVELINDVRSRTMLPIHVDVPTWYERVPSGSTNLFDALLASVDGAAIMNYRTDVARFVRGAATELAAGAKAEKPIVIGISVERNQSPKVGFHTWADLEAAVRAARERWAASNHAPRLAIQSYRHVKRALGID